MTTKYITTICESQSFIFNNHVIYIWDKFSSITDDKVEVADPVYKQKYLFNIWLLKVGSEKFKFAIGEFTNSMYGIFLVE